MIEINEKYLTDEPEGKLKSLKTKVLMQHSCGNIMMSLKYWKNVGTVNQKMILKSRFYPW